ncbi:MAG TPA: DinB family protein [Beijerinckiaceae bacterium]|nr:DinB family protein [Beijerinckiaceae bacterium]
MKSTFTMLAGYNAWANARVYDAAGQLSDAEYRADRGAFFKSMHGTLNHLLVTDRLWLRRFTGEGDAPNRLDAILFEEFFELRAARKSEDARIGAYIDGLTEDRIAAMFRYSTVTNPREIEQPLGPALTHFFNHQTHHRGQVHCMLTQAGGQPHATDLPQTPE